MPKSIFTVYRQRWLCLPLKLTSSMHLYKQYPGTAGTMWSKSSCKTKGVKDVDFQPKIKLNHGKGTQRSLQLELSLHQSPHLRATVWSNIRIWACACVPYTALEHKTRKAGRNAHTDRFQSARNEHKPPNTNADHFQHRTSNSVTWVELKHLRAKSLVNQC